MRRSLGIISIPRFFTFLLLANRANAQAPSLTSLPPANGPVGTSVTITGTNFGATQGPSTVSLNGAAATPTSWSATSILVAVPSSDAPPGLCHRHDRRTDQQRCGLPGRYASLHHQQLKSSDDESPY